MGELEQADMESKRVVSRARAEQFAAEVGGILCETSAKENWGVNELFTKVKRRAVRHLEGSETACVRPPFLSCQCILFPINVRRFMTCLVRLRLSVSRRFPKIVFIDDGRLRLTLLGANIVFYTNVVTKIPERLN